MEEITESYLFENLNHPHNVNLICTPQDKMFIHIF